MIYFQNWKCLYYPYGEEHSVKGSFFPSCNCLGVGPFKYFDGYFYILRRKHYIFKTRHLKHEIYCGIKKHTEQFPFYLLKKIKNF